MKSIYLHTCNANLGEICLLLLAMMILGKDWSGEGGFYFYVVGSFVVLRQGLSEAQATLKSALPRLSLDLNLCSPASPPKC